MHRSHARSLASLCLTAALAAAIWGAAPAVAETGTSVTEPVDPAPVEVSAPQEPPSIAVEPAAMVQERPKSLPTKVQQWLHLTTKSEETLDLDGVEPSLYRGRFYRAHLETKRRCIVHRESNGHYFSISRSGYRGAYQMSAALAQGVTWMMLPEHQVLLGDQVARELLARLRQTPANRWPRYWQDAAFSTIHNWEYTGSGASHWYGGRWHC
jgi:hypothetical protein